MDSSFWNRAGAAATIALALLGLLQFLIQWQKSRVNLIATIDRGKADIPGHLLQFSDYLKWRNVPSRSKDQADPDQEWAKLVASVTDCRLKDFGHPAFVIDISVRNGGSKVIKNIEIQVDEPIFAEKDEGTNSPCVSFPITIQSLRPNEQHRFRIWTSTPLVAVNIFQELGKPKIREQSAIYGPVKARYMRAVLQGMWYGLIISVLIAIILI